MKAPPLISMSSPVIYAASSAARKAMVKAISSGFAGSAHRDTADYGIFILIRDALPDFGSNCSGGYTVYGYSFSYYFTCQCFGKSEYSCLCCRVMSSSEYASPLLGLKQNSCLRFVRIYFFSSVQLQPGNRERCFSGLHSVTRSQSASVV